jgi:hypothetical protein
MHAVSFAVLTFCALASVADIDVMTRKNPARLLGLEP